MTSLQVDYWKLEETKRTNVANENLRAQELAETTRHNQQTEAIGWAQVGEQSRHNKTTELIGAYSAITDRIHEYNWKAVQDSQIALREREADIAEDRNKLQELDIELGFKRLDWEKEKWLPEYENEVRQLDQREKELELDKSAETRKWVTDIFSMGERVITGYNDANRNSAKPPVTWVGLVGKAISVFGG